MSIGKIDRRVRGSQIPSAFHGATPHSHRPRRGMKTRPKKGTSEVLRCGGSRISYGASIAFGRAVLHQPVKVMMLSPAVQTKEHTPTRPMQTPPVLQITDRTGGGPAKTVGGAAWPPRQAALRPNAAGCQRET